MGKGKPHIEFTALDMEVGWEVPPGYPVGIKQRILAADIDESSKTGSRSRLLHGPFKSENGCLLLELHYHHTDSG